MRIVADLLLLFLVCILFVFVVVGCASVQTERPAYAFETAETAETAETGERAEASAPQVAYDGPRRRAQVIRFGIPREIAEQYPELTDRRVGWGLSNRIVEGFYDTGRFEFLEEKTEMLDRMTAQWKLSMAGLVAEDAQVEAGHLRAPSFLIYAEVYDFAVSYGETVVGVALKKENTTILGLQVRLVDVETGAYVAASGRGEAASTAVGAWVNPALPFDQSTVGLAADRAVRAALSKLMARMDAQAAATE